MGSKDTTEGRRLQLDRETLRDLAPTAAEAAAVHGGDDNSATSPRSCLPRPTSLLQLGSTMTSYGCKGIVKVLQTDDGHEIHFDLRPNDATLELHEIAVQEAKARMPELSERLDALKKQRGI